MNVRPLLYAMCLPAVLLAVPPVVARDTIPSPAAAALDGVTARDLAQLRVDLAGAGFAAGGSSVPSDVQLAASPIQIIVPIVAPIVAPIVVPIVINAGQELVAFLWNWWRDQPRF